MQCPYRYIVRSNSCRRVYSSIQHCKITTNAVLIVNCELNMDKCKLLHLCRYKKVDKNPCDIIYKTASVVNYVSTMMEQRAFIKWLVEDHWDTIYEKKSYMRTLNVSALQWKETIGWRYCLNEGCVNEWMHRPIWNYTVRICTKFHFRAKWHTYTIKTSMTHIWDEIYDLKVCGWNCVC